VRLFDYYGTADSTIGPVAIGFTLLLVITTMPGLAYGRVCGEAEAYDRATDPPRRRRSSAGSGLPRLPTHGGQGAIAGAIMEEAEVVHMSKVVHFEIQADDIERAKSFYAAAFGWTFEDYGHVTGSPYWGVIAGPDDEPGINGGLQQRSASAPGPEQGTNAFVATVSVDDYDATEQRILDAGGRVALPKMALTGMAWQGYYLDTEGNTFGIHPMDPEAR
jgi:predicted enzyme related to lactoylglutathione lyase